MVAASSGTHQRNEVWRTDESLWRDVTIKSPENGRGLMGYATTFLNRGDYATAIGYLERARPLMPNYSGIEINLGIAYGAAGRDGEAVQHFEHAAELAPGVAEPHFYYGRWLESKGRLAEAQAQLETAVRFSPLSFPARNLLLEVYSRQGNQPAFDALVQETLRLGYNEETARRYAEERAKLQKAATIPQQPTPQQPQNRRPEALLNLSAKYCNEGNYAECLAMAKQALDLRPGYAEAYNNMAAAYNSMEQWDEAIRAASEAVRLKPDYPVARKNLDWARAHRQAQNGGR
jgi:protein O-mannosyl-transferase